ncbi:hypothetical protein [Fictibacillus phosphorivorans]|uniref:hypothetical protein n=1 Tax=Fictibacillus phosphorivorans TaxID=1221500 RepID=UPI00119FDCD7|nr:hypothetical protein [Fictibacillus phosphorivorans]
MKSYKLVVLTLFLVLVSVTAFPGISAKAAINNKPGDIIITNSTSSSGIVGHSGIYITDTTILHTSGWKSEPYPTVLTESQWHSRYEKSKVVRSSSSTLGKNAANKAIYYFKGKKITYKITSGPTNIASTYCSELVWYSYYKAGKTFKTRNSSGSFYQPTSPTPYNFIDKFNVSHNGFTFIDNSW